jgi:negative regulator of sigma-B (phosphoserine phosphatase)
VTTVASRSVPVTLIEWGVAGRTRAGEDECGDRYLVRPFSDGVLLAVVDGLGHGREAAAAGSLAAAVLDEHAGETLPDLVQRCHEALAGSRGVVMSVASVDRTGTLSWLGVGNVEALRVRAGDRGAEREDQLLLRAGVVGFRLPALRPSRLSLARGDLLALATDGVRSGFGRCLTGAKRPQQLAETVLAEYGRSSDDALVVVARFEGVRR